MRRIYLFGLVSSVFFFVGACNKSSLKVGFLLPNFTDARYVKDRDFFTAKVTQLGATVEIGDANNDPDLQFEEARKMIDNGIRVLVVTAVNQNLAASIVRLAHENGVKVIAYERLIQNSDLDYLVAFDHFLVGKQQAGYAIQKKSGGNFFLIGGDKTDKNAELIEKGQLEVLEPLSQAKKINILYNVYVEEWSSENAYQEVRKALRLLGGEKVDVVLSANDGMAGGVIKALQEAQPGYPVIITGLDADIKACQFIAEGKQTMTIYKPFKKQAESAAELAVQILKRTRLNTFEHTTFNGKREVPTILLQPIPVDFSNIKTTVVSDGFYKEEDIFNKN